MAKRVEWLNVRVFRKDWEDGGVSYTASMSGHPWNKERKQADERWISLWHQLQFPQGQGVPDRTVINLRGNEYPQERYNGQAGKYEVVPKIIIEQFEVVSQGVQQNQGFNQNQGFQQNQQQTQGFQQNQQQNNQQNNFGWEEIQGDIPF